MGNTSTRKIESKPVPVVPKCPKKKRSAPKMINEVVLTEECGITYPEGVKELLDKYYTSVDFFWEVNDERWEEADTKFKADVANVAEKYKEKGTFSPDIWDEIIKKQFTQDGKNWKDNKIITEYMVDCRFKYWVKNRQTIESEVAYVRGLKIEMKLAPNCLPLEKRWANLNKLFRKVQWSKPGESTPPPVHTFTKPELVEKLKL